MVWWCFNGISCYTLRQDVAISSLLDGVRPTRSISSLATSESLFNPQISTPRTSGHSTILDEPTATSSPVDYVEELTGSTWSGTTEAEPHWLLIQAVNTMKECRNHTLRLATVNFGYWFWRSTRWSNAALAADSGGQHGEVMPHWLLILAVNTVK